MSRMQTKNPEINHDHQLATVDSLLGLDLSDQELVSLITSNPDQIGHFAFIDVRQLVEHHEGFDELQGRRITDVISATYDRLEHKYQKRVDKAKDRHNNSDVELNSNILGVIKNVPERGVNISGYSNSNKAVKTEHCAAYYAAIAYIDKIVPYRSFRPIHFRDSRFRNPQTARFIELEKLAHIPLSNRVPLLTSRSDYLRYASRNQQRQFARNYTAREISRDLLDELSSPEGTTVANLRDIAYLSSGVIENTDEIFVDDYLIRGRSGVLNLDRAITELHREAGRNEELGVIPDQSIEFHMLPPSEFWTSTSEDGEESIDGFEFMEKDRKRILAKLYHQWKQAGYSVKAFSCPDFSDNDESFKKYIIITRTKGEDPTDAVAVSERYGEATYMIRGDEFNWKQMFKLTKEEFRNYTKDYNKGAVTINNAGVEESVIGASIYLDSQELPEWYSRIGTARRAAGRAAAKLLV